MPEPFGVRVGLHVGEADERAQDYFGPAVTRAARVMSLGALDQILLSEAAVEAQELFSQTFSLRQQERGAVRCQQVGDGRSECPIGFGNLPGVVLPGDNWVVTRSKRNL